MELLQTGMQVKQDLDYKTKYIKYKTKYILLQNELSNNLIGGKLNKNDDIVNFLRKAKISDRNLDKNYIKTYDI